jgi:DNA-binding transcriptional regulator PaaX
MSITDEILFFLSNNPGSYRQLRIRLHSSYPVDKRFDRKNGKRSKRQPINEKSFRTILSQLKKKGYVSNDGGLWKITKLGQKKKESGNRRERLKNQIKKTDTGRKIIIAFDIPEYKKSKRYWLRSELLNLEFEMMQNRVWIGTAPLPVEFVNDLKRGGIHKYLKFFEVKPTDVV